ncbi:MAG: 4-(cytidine 5'-diphospho)-2-C-methyl-D-erythritol kinase [Lachnospiraceae bacterium]|nr:4-(cytidine 5'-diphospho)-2-C-methyl-D-erythritol kinase [Lachnospiraceae bacterium]
MGSREPSLELKAYAKINLGLDIERKREDGYHELKTIMQQIDLYDVIKLYAEAESGGSEEQGQILISCSDSLVPSNERNLAYKAARLLFDEFDITDAVLIEIEKNIPVSAGLAGGSTDAAAVLKGINEYFGLGLSQEELIERGVKLGADVPFCIMGGTAYAGGVGEELVPLGVMDDYVVLVAVPDTRVSTKWAYNAYDELAAGGNVRHPDIDQMRAAIEMEDFGCIPEFLGNVLEYATIPEYPVISKVKSTMMQNGAAGALMSGSGPSVYGLFMDEEKAAKAYDVLDMFELVPEERIFLTGFHNQ